MAEPGSPPSGGQPDDVIAVGPSSGLHYVRPRPDMALALEGLERRVNRERAEDLEYVMRSLTAAEMRTGSWMDQTEDALTMLAMRQDPRFTER